MEQIATFYNHFGALSFHRRVNALGDRAVMMPVPRKLSTSCGTCVKFFLDFTPELVSEELEAVYACEAGAYREIFCNEE